VNRETTNEGEERERRERGQSLTNSGLKNWNTPLLRAEEKRRSQTRVSCLREHPHVPKGVNMSFNGGTTKKVKVKSGPHFVGCRSKKARRGGKNKEPENLCQEGTEGRLLTWKEDENLEENRKWQKSIELEQGMRESQWGERLGQGKKE